MKCMDHQLRLVDPVSPFDVPALFEVTLQLVFSMKKTVAEQW